MSTPPSSRNEFHIAGADQSFGSRTTDVFASLDTIEAKHVAQLSCRGSMVERRGLLKPDPVTDDDIIYPVLQSAVFKKPSNVRPGDKASSIVCPSRSIKSADYTANPANWKK